MPRYVILWLLTALLLAGCSAPGITPTPTALPEVTMPASRAAIGDQPTPTPETGLIFDLSPGAQQPPAGGAAPLAAAEPLTAAEVQAILNRLPALEPTAGDVEGFKFPPQTLPAPRPGKTVA
ncbi:MAG: hypothetical protein ACUVSS_14740, partial [Anaerolineae bacterium]